MPAGFNKPKNQDPRKNMGAAAHLIRGSSDGRFSITCAVKEVSQQEIENVMDGKEIYYVPNPTPGLWINREKFEG